MQVRFTKMQGAGNDFVVLNETTALLGLSRDQYRFLADRRFGVGADQILSVRPSPGPGIDFEYVIHNADGGEVEHCGNGARCFARFVRERGLSTAAQVRVKVRHGVLTLHEDAQGQVTVDMGAPIFDLAQVPFAPEKLVQPPAVAAPESVAAQAWPTWPLSVADGAGLPLQGAVLSMGNPHAVLRVDHVERADVAGLGPKVQALAAFPQGVNVGFVQVRSRNQVALRVYERGAGETLACGTGACAAVVAGIRLGWLDASVQVHTRGGVLHIRWDGATDLAASVFMSGPATTVFEGVIDVPEHPAAPNLTLLN
jgi:diaminopimelate epimerase